jgi:predicted Zn-dependent peptidase
MRDRQVFIEGQLRNGIRTFDYRDESPYTSVTIRVPVGSVNSTGRFLPGTFHFLEHLVMKRSKNHPHLKEYERMVGLKGGNIDAETSAFWTTYILEIPTKHFEEVLPGFFSLVFEPLLLEEDIQHERGVISSERKKKERWFPGQNEEQQYLYTKWQRDCFLSLRQRLGEEKDLGQMNEALLRAAHSHYLDSETWVMSAGSGDPTLLYTLIEGLEVNSHAVASAYFEPLTWVNQDYHEHGFRDLSRFVLRYGCIMKPRPESHIIRASDFILSYLTNTVHGPLYHWLREENDWVYELGWSGAVTTSLSHDWTLRFPLANLEQVSRVRQELAERVEMALRNGEAISLEVDRLQSKADAYWYPTLGPIVKDARTSLALYGRILSEAELRKRLEKCRDAAYLQEVWSYYFTSENMGCFCATPLPEKKN